jgi:hypothetical protein
VKGVSEKRVEQVGTGQADGREWGACFLHNNKGNIKNKSAYL